jgi:hypothetical protein
MSKLTGTGSLDLCNRLNSGAPMGQDGRRRIDNHFLTATRLTMTAN